MMQQIADFIKVTEKNLKLNEEAEVKGRGFKKPIETARKEGYIAALKDALRTIKAIDKEYSTFKK